MNGDRTAWLEWRRTGITATDTAGILGLSPYASPYSIWAEKAGLLPEQEVTDAMQFGTRAEPMLAQWFHDKTGLHVLGEQTWCTHPEKSWMLATVDGFVSDSPNGSVISALGGCEFKTTTDTAAEWDEHIPDHIACQVQWQMAVTGLPRTWLATLHLGFRVEFRIREIEADGQDIAALVKVCEPFWTDHCVAGVPPMVDGSDATTNALRESFPGDDELDAIEADDDLLFSRQLIVDYKADIKRLEESVGEHENRIRAALGDHTAVTAGVDAKGKPVIVATWRPSTRTSLDSAALKAEMPDIAAKFTKTTPTRTLLVKTPKAK